MTVQEKDKQFIANTYGRFPLQIVEGKGSLCYDENGKEYIDLGTGIAVNTFGFCDDEWIKATTAQMQLFQHTSNLYYSQPCIKLAEMLCQRTGMKKVFFSNSGAEANECAIKTARKYAENKKGKDAYHIITLVNSFHGRTITTLSATGQDVFHQDFLPLTDGFLYVNAGDIDAVKALVKEYKIAAIMFELVQGEGGVLPLEQAFVKQLSDLAKEEDILLIADEVQTGNGRTGTLFAYMQYAFTPDIVTTAKGLGGGLPIGATLFHEKTENVLQAGMHGSTFGGNPIASSGAISILSRLDEKLFLQVREKSQYIQEQLKGSKGIKSVTGLGLMLGLEVDKPAKEIAVKCLQKGVIVLTAKTKIRLLPALNIPYALLDKALQVIKEVCGE